MPYKSLFCTSDRCWIRQYFDLPPAIPFNWKLGLAINARIIALEASTSPVGRVTFYSLKRQLGRYRRDAAMNEREIWHDTQLGAAVKAMCTVLRAEARPIFENLITRLCYLNRILGTYDERFERQTLAAIDDGEMKKASGLAWLIYSPQRCERILGQATLDHLPLLPRLPSASSRRAALSVR